MDIIALSGVAVISAVIAVMLKKHNPEYSVVLSICAGVLMLILIMSKLETITSRINSLIKVANIDSSYIGVLLKSLGICFMTQFASDSCIDAGESSLASKIEFVGKIMIIASALPLFEKVINTALSLLK